MGRKRAPSAATIGRHTNTFFISRTNFHYFNESNFTIFDTLDAPRTQDLSRIEDYTLGDKFACCRDIEKTFSHYLDVINRTERQ